MNPIRRGPLALVLVLLTFVAACASTPDAGGDDGDGSSRDVITMAQLDAAGGRTAYQVVRQLKPHWLQRRGQVSFQGQTSLLVVVDDSHREVGVLNTLRAEDIREIRYLDGRRAMMRYGDRANGGALIITLR